MKEPILSIKDLKTYFYTSIGTVKAVDGINLDINEGEAVGLVGNLDVEKVVLHYQL